MRQFKCHSCGKKSRYRQQKQQMEFFAEFKTSLSTDETRIYECEHCSTENEIEQSEATWAIIDADRGP